jgi:hypothetical protein
MPTGFKTSRGWFGHAENAANSQEPIPQPLTVGEQCNSSGVVGFPSWGILDPRIVKR